MVVHNFYLFVNHSSSNLWQAASARYCLAVASEWHKFHSHNKFWIGCIHHQRCINWRRASYLPRLYMRKWYLRYFSNLQYWLLYLLFLPLRVSVTYSCISKHSGSVTAGFFEYTSFKDKNDFWTSIFNR